MKYLLFILLLPAISLAEDRFTKSMENTIEELYQADTIPELQKVANKFNRISAAEEDQWLPRYYSALAGVWMASREGDPASRDQWLDQAQESLTQANALSPANSEIVALQGFIYMMRVTVDPATRGATYSPKAFGEFGKATTLDELNPRALFFKGQMEYGTAQFFKSDTQPACDTMARSLELFDNFTPESSIHPNWGSSMAKRTVERCK